MRRTWVVQNPFLVPRVLHLTKMEIFWGCYELSACESYLHGLPLMMRERRISRDAIWGALLRGWILLYGCRNREFDIRVST